MDSLSEINFRVNFFFKDGNLDFFFCMDYFSQINLNFRFKFFMWPHKAAKCGGIGLVEVEILSFQSDTWPLLITWSDSYNFIMGFASPYVSTLQSLVATSLLEEEIFCFYFVRWSYVTSWSEGHVTRWVRLPHHKSSVSQVS